PLRLEGEVRRVARGVGERAGLGDRAHEGRDPPVVAAQLEDLLDDRAVLALELADANARRLLVGTLLYLDAEVTARVGVGRAGDSAVQAVQHDGVGPAREAHALQHLGDGADLRVRAVVL